jgi:hypothetical protein
MLAHGEAIAAMRAHARPAGHRAQPHARLPGRAARRGPPAAQIDDGLSVRWYMDPIFRGAYSADLIEHLGADAPRIASGDLALIRQPLDFLGINFYTRSFISTRQPPLPAPGEPSPTWAGRSTRGLTQHLVRLSREYALPPMYITENGMANADSVVDGRVKDEARIAYLSRHLQALATAIALGVDVRGYFYWSLLDNFEWNSGYTKRFGLFHVDYATQQRVAKDSALVSGPDRASRRAALKRSAASPARSDPPAHICACNGGAGAKLAPSRVRSCPEMRGSLAGCAGIGGRLLRDFPEGRARGDNPSPGCPRPPVLVIPEVCRRERQAGAALSPTDGPPLVAWRMHSSAFAPTRQRSIGHFQALSCEGD